MIKITKVAKIVVYEVETDDSEYPIYRTDGKGNWENLMGESWETGYGSYLEEQFKEWIQASQTT